MRIAVFGDQITDWQGELEELIAGLWGSPAHGPRLDVPCIRNLFTSWTW